MYVIGDFYYLCRAAHGTVLTKLCKANFTKSTCAFLSSVDIILCLFIFRKHFQKKNSIDVVSISTRAFTLTFMIYNYVVFLCCFITLDLQVLTAKVMKQKGRKGNTEQNIFLLLYLCNSF